MKNLQPSDAQYETADVIRGACEPRVVAPHHHERYAIAVATSGSHAMRCRGSSHIVAPGRVVMLGPREIHEAAPISERGWSYAMMYIDERLVSSVAESLRGRKGELAALPRPVVNDPVLRRHVLGVCRAAQRRAPLEVDVRTSQAVTYLVTRHLSVRTTTVRQTGEHRAVREIECFLRCNYATTVRLADLAALVGLHANYLVGVFALGTGAAPHQYLDQIRVARAQELISRGLSLSAIAAEVGYCDQSHLTRQFKRMLGVTPGAYRRANSRRVAV